MVTFASFATNEALASGRCSAKLKVPHSHYHAKVDTASLMTCKFAQRLAVAASVKLARLQDKHVYSRKISIKGYPLYLCDDTQGGDAAGNYYFTCAEKHHATRFVNWTYGPYPV